MFNISELHKTWELQNLCNRHICCRDLDNATQMCDVRGKQHKPSKAFQINYNFTQIFSNTCLWVRPKVKTEISYFRQLLYLYNESGKCKLMVPHSQNSNSSLPLWASRSTFHPPKKQHWVATNQISNPGSVSPSLCPLSLKDFRLLPLVHLSIHLLVVFCRASVIYLAVLTIPES